MKTYLALDIGEKRIGAAVGSIVPFGRGTIIVESDEQVLAMIRNLLASDQVTDIIIGVPYVKSGEETPSQTRAKQWAVRLQSDLSLPVHLVDESYTSVEAERQLREEGIDTAAFKDKIDERSAMIMLQQFLEEQTHETRIA